MRKLVGKAIFGIGFLTGSIGQLPQLFAAPPTGVQVKHTSIAIEDCIIAASDSWDEIPEIDYLSMKCPAFGGYEVGVRGGDIRYGLVLDFNGSSIETDNPGSFHGIFGNKVEWRYTIKKTSDWEYDINLHSLVYELSFQDYSREKDEFFENSRVVVMKLDGERSCVAGKFDADEFKDATEQYSAARQFADRPLSCLR